MARIKEPKTERNSTEDVDDSVMMSSKESEEVVKPLPPKMKAEPLIPFSKWFSSKGFKDRWRAGMASYTDITVRRTTSEWDEIFKSY